MREKISNWTACHSHDDVAIDEAEERLRLIQWRNPRIISTVSEDIIGPSGAIALRKSISICIITSLFFCRIILLHVTNEELCQFLIVVRIASMFQLVSSVCIELTSSKWLLRKPSTWMLPINESVDLVSHNQPVVILG